MVFSSPRIHKIVSSLDTAVREQPQLQGNRAHALTFPKFLLLCPLVEGTSMVRSSDNSSNTCRTQNRRALVPKEVVFSLGLMVEKMS